MQPVQLCAMPGSASNPGRICLVPKRAGRRVALQLDVQAAEELQHADVPPMDSGLGSTASSTSAEVRAFLQTCVSMHARPHNLPARPCMRAAQTTCTLVLMLDKVCCKALLKRLPGQ